MRLFLTAALAAALVPACVLAQSSRSIDLATGGEMRLVQKTGHTQIIAANAKGTVIVDPTLRTDAEYVSETVGAWTREHSAEFFGLSDDAELREYAHTRVGELWQTSYELLYNDIPVRERSVKMNVGVQSGAVMMIRSTVTSARPTSVTPTVAPDAIIKAAGKDVNTATEIGEAQLLYIDNGKTLTLAYEVIAGTPHQERYRLTYDATTGNLLEKKSLLFDRCFEGPGEEASIEETTSPAPQKHQLPQATAGGRVTAIIHPLTPNDQQEEVGLPGMDVLVNGVKATTDSLGYWTLPSVTYPLSITSNLSNANFNVRTSGLLVSVITNTVTSGPANLQWNDDNSRASDRDALYSLLRTRLYIKGLDPNLKFIDQLLRADIDYDATCNAMYDPTDRSFTFFKESSTCNSTARVADVVYHEYGHRVNHCYYLETEVKNMQDASLNEGFADIYSALQRDNPRIGQGFYTNPSQILRNCDNARKWPTHLAGDPHTNGSIVAGAYWDLRKATDINIARQLFAKTCALTPDGNGAIDEVSMGDAFTNVLVATIMADDDDNDLSNATPHVTEILASFKKHNITLAGLLDLRPQQLEDQPATADGYPVSVKAAYTGPIGSLDETSLVLSYSTNGTSYTDLPLTKATGDTYEAVIPKVAPGTIVNYYASAKTTLGDKNETPLKEASLKFLVGFERRFVDNFESNKGWLKSDSAATTGKWERGDPFGTSFAGAELLLVQQDTDHTANGTNCYITGNLNTSSPSADDVDNGIVRLTSPVFDMSTMNDPYIRFWYYLSNDMGQNPGLSSFDVEIGGENWVQAMTTTTTTASWQQALIRVKDIMPLSSNISVRFVASDLIGSLVEAGVDDFEILDPVKPQESVEMPSSTATKLEVYPQPITSSIFRITALPSQGVAHITVKDLLGVRVLEEIVNLKGDDLTLSLPSSILNGVYILEVESGEYRGQQKVVVMR